MEPVFTLPYSEYAAANLLSARFTSISHPLCLSLSFCITSVSLSCAIDPDQLVLVQDDEPILRYRYCTCTYGDAIGYLGFALLEGHA